MVESIITLDAAKPSLNTFLANTLEERFDIQDITVDDQVFQRFCNGPWSSMFDSEAAIALLTEFMVNEAIARTRLDQELELAVRRSVLQLLNTHTNIEFSEQAATNALFNYELIQHNYLLGTVNITQLIDAQRALVQAQLVYAVSIYDYMVAQLQFEFTVGSFSVLASEEETQAVQQRFLEFQSNR